MTIPNPMTLQGTIPTTWVSGYMPVTPALGAEAGILSLRQAWAT